MTQGIVIQQLNKTYGRGGRAYRALRDISLEVDTGEMVALIGASGAGKSTLLRHIAGLEAADSSNSRCAVRVLGRAVQSNGKLFRGKRHERANTGMIFQQFNLVGRLSVLTNVCLGLLGRIPTWRGSLSLFSQSEKLAAMEALERVGMVRFAAQRASTLSGGQQQRVAIARTLVQGAQLILADEPIASLDPASSTRVMQALRDINDSGITVIVSLHQVSYAAHYCPRTLAMRDGEIAFDGDSKALTADFLTQLYGEDSEQLILGKKPLQVSEKQRRDAFDDVVALASAG